MTAILTDLGMWICRHMHNRRSMENWGGYYCGICHKRRVSSLKNDQHIFSEVIR